MGGRFDRERKRARARSAYKLNLSTGECPKCGARDTHFVPPGMGDPGFFICEADSRFKGKTLREGVDRG